MICSELNPSATKSSAPGATTGPRGSRSGTRAKPSPMSSATGCANCATAAAKTDWPNFAKCCGSSGAATQWSSAERPARQRRQTAQIGLSRTKSATNRLLLRQRSGRETPLAEARLLRSLAKTRRGPLMPPPPAGRMRADHFVEARAGQFGAEGNRRRAGRTRFFCRTGGGSLPHPLNSDFVQRISSGHSNRDIAG